ncbi:hypothetical protein [Phytohabitans aurantiacus]|jgi:hypothetical protein|uniref:Uncharacterized protein n=1 Tax=Phytohabitans aurantiacus TaxID=3016789 RepID=A0ABQ5R364_9ACTN|nr:hypothetical protein [Phytohabitans aurantiacus]GLI00850.1 hypothetical protein Pa4123_61260 [Phytohabitans aurantiacus]
MRDWEPWRVEADDEWLLSHSTDSFARIRRVFHPVSGAGDAVSHSVLGGLLGGTPRNPELKVKGVQAEQIRYAEKHYSYTATRVEVGVCRRCDHRLQERHHMLLVAADGRRAEIGRARACRACDAGSWMFVSHMPRARRRAAEIAKIVL